MASIKITDEVIILTVSGIVLPTSAECEGAVSEFGFASIVEAGQFSYVVTTKHGCYGSVHEVKRELKRLSDEWAYDCSVQEAADAFDF
jgi:hypothetical protein